MNCMRKAAVAGLAVAIGMTVPACGKVEVEAPEPRPRPVAVVELQRIDPVGPLQLTGAVQAWKEADVAFEVSGPVAFVVEAGDNLEGQWEPDGKLLVKGDVLARLDTSLFEIRKATSAAAVVVAEENLRLAVVRLEEVLPAQVEAALAELVRADAEHTRVKAAHERNAMSEIDLIRAKADKDGTAARHVEAEAEIASMKAEIIGLQAVIDEAEATLVEAQYNLDHCVLYAPFNAQVSEVYIEAGGYARASDPVAHLIMMDPVEVDIAVSQDTASRLQVSDRVLLKVSGVDRTFEASVHEEGDRRRSQDADVPYLVDGPQRQAHRLAPLRTTRRCSCPACRRSGPCCSRRSPRGSPPVGAWSRRRGSSSGTSRAGSCGSPTE